MFVGKGIIVGIDDHFVFASSCENMPNTLVEAIAAGLPLACSRRGPMHEILGDTGLYFDPESHLSIAEAIRRLIDDPLLRDESASRARRPSQQSCPENSALAGLCAAPRSGPTEPHVFMGRGACPA